MSNNPQVGQKLKFRVVDISGEDPEYPANELLSQSPQSKGWQSPRFCDWPQYITLQFVNPVMLKQLQFLSHQCKIASKIELYTALPDLKSPVPTLELKFKKLGYLSLDPNERSGYQSRELKTVYVECPCLYLKVVFQKCHINKYNLFNQVGLIAIGCFGEPMANVKENNLKLEGNGKYDKLEYETQFDSSTLERLKDLEDAKAKAIREENFDEAKKIKEAIERLKHIGAQLQALEERKVIAIQNEDFDSAKIIKQEIERLREAVAPNNLVRKYKEEYDEQPVQKQVQQAKQQKVTYGIPQEQDDNRPIRGNRGPPREYEEPEEVKQEQIPHDELPINQKKKTTNMGGGGGNASNKQLFKNKNADDDDRPLPALQNKDKQMSEYPDDGGDGGNNAGSEAEFLTNENLKLAEPLIPIIGEELARKIFSKTWNLREDGLRILEQESGLEGRSKVINFSDPGAAFTAFMGVVNYTITDKIGQVSQKSMSFLQKILSKEPKGVPNRGELNSFIDGVIMGLLDKIGDNNAKVRQQAENAFMAMAGSNLVTCAYCVQALVKNPSGSNTKLKNINSTKHVLARLGLLRQIIQEYKVANQNVPYNNVITYVIDKLENSNADIRQAAFNIIVDIYSLIGEKIRGDLANVRPQHMEMLQKEFDNIGGGGGGSSKPNYEQKETVITTNINPQGAGPGAKKAGNANSNAKGGNTKGAQGNKGPTSGDANANPGAVCEFCGRQDRNLLDPGKMDIHLWKECPVLTTCQNCAQVVEISTLNHHLLDECENRKVMRKCPRCKEAIKMEEYKLHTDEMSCSPQLPAEEANRCPLCHQDIAAGEIGWKRHLLTEGCPNNDRTF